MAEERSSEVPGIDVAAVDDWIARDVPSLTRPFRWRLLAGGHSNLTHAIDDATGATAVVRRPPLGDLLRGAHDVEREFRIIAALWPAGVPVAQPLACCADPEITGAPFSVMSFVDGRTLESRDDAAAWLSEPARLVLSESYIDTLATLHAVDPIQAGLGTLARHDGFVARQLKAWYRSWTSNAADAGYDDERVHRIHDLLAERQPAEGPPRLIHGDCGLNNCLIGSDGTVRALVDWEVATLGQPLADLAFAINRWSTPDDPILGREDAPSNLPGFLHRSRLATRYAERTGIDVSDLAFYELLNHWRSACIAHGVYARYLRGQRGHEGVDIERFRTAVGIRLQQAQEAAEMLAR